MHKHRCIHTSTLIITYLFVGPNNLCNQLLCTHRHMIHTWTDGARAQAPVQKELNHASELFFLNDRRQDGKGGLFHQNWRDWLGSFWCFNIIEHSLDHKKHLMLKDQHASEDHWYICLRENIFHVCIQRRHQRRGFQIPWILISEYS